MFIMGIEVKWDMGKWGIDECCIVEEIGERLCWWDVVVYVFLVIDIFYDYYFWFRFF